MSKPHLLRKKFKLPDGHPIKCFVMREIDGEDELEAGRVAAARGTSVDDMSQAALMENIRVAIVSVDDKPVEQPFLQMDKYPSKTKRYFIEAWVALNGVGQDDIKNFLAAAEVLA
jgi:hypothetical protein